MKNASFQRIFDLDRYIRAGKLESAKQAAKEFQVSQRTIERDLDMLKTMGAEIRYNRSKKCYEYKGNPITLPAQWMKERDIALMLIAERSLRMYTGAFPTDEIHPVFNRFLDPVRHDQNMMGNIRELCKSVHFNRPFEVERPLKQVFSRVLDAIMKKQRISMGYHGADGKVKVRQLDPYVLLNDGGDWYVIGKCHVHGEIRKFSLDRIYNPRRIDHFFAIPRYFKVSDFLKQGFGRMRGRVPQDIALRISGTAVSWVSRRKWHASQTIDEKRDGSIVLQMKVPVTETLVNWILSMGGEVKIVKPANLRQAVVKKAKAILRKN